MATSLETKMDDDEEGKCFEIRKACFSPRPFSFIANPYDHACSVLCNHPQGNTFNWIARRLALLSLATRDDKATTVLRSPSKSTPSLPSPTRKSAPAEPKKPAFSFLKEYRDIYALPQTTLQVTQSKLEDEMKSVIKVKKRKKPAGAVKSDGKKGGVTRRKMKRSKKKKVKQVKMDMSVATVAVVDDRLMDSSALLTATAPTRKRRFAEKKKFLFGDVDNPETLVEDERVGENGDRSLDGCSNGDELDDELNGNELDPKNLECLQSLLLASEATGAAECALDKVRQPSKELKSIKDELNASKKGFDNLMRFPKIPSRRCCRFELPMDTDLLIGLKPLSYLQRYCVVTGKRRQLIEKIFGKFRNAENVILPQNMFKAAGEAFGESVLSKEHLSAVCQLADVDADRSLRLDHFTVLVALAERYLCHCLRSCEGKEEGEKREGEWRDSIEEMDFSYLTVYKSSAQIDDNLNTLLMWIKSS